MKHIQTFESFVNEAANQFKVEDFAVGSHVHFKDGEEWLVVEPGMRRPDSRRKDDEITMKPFNKKAKDSNVSLAIDFTVEYLNKEVTKIDKG